MTLIVKYPNLNAKLKGMYSKKISKSSLNDLIKQTSLNSAVLFLKSKYDIFKDVDKNIDRLMIESLLDKSQIVDIKKIIKLMSLKDLELFHVFLLRYENSCVKSIFRKIYSNNKTEDIIKHNTKMWIDSLFKDISGIENTSNLNEFFDYIKPMKYNKIFQKYKNESSVNIFEVESEIDKLYFEVLYDRIRGNNNLRKIIGSEIDLLNVMWIYRVNKYYYNERDKLLNILINRYYKLDVHIIDKLINASNFNQIKNIMDKTIYKNIFLSEKEFENNIDKYLYKINKNVFNNNVLDVSYIYAYINLIDYENNDIINIIEGIRYGISKTEIKKRMVSRESD